MIYMCFDIEYEINGAINYMVGDEIMGRNDEIFNYPPVESVDVSKLADIIDVDLFVSSNYKIVKYLPNYSTAINIPINKYVVEEVILSEGITDIEDYFFNVSHNLKKVTLPSTLKTIGNFAFDCAFVLEDVVIPDSVEEMGSWVFGNCKKLKNIRIPTGISQIPYLGFYSNSVEYLYIPKNIEYIDSLAFSSCYNLHVIEFEDELPEIHEKAFDTCLRIYKIIYKNQVFGSFEDLFDFVGENKKVKKDLYVYPDDNKLDVFKSGVKVIMINHGIGIIDSFAFQNFVNAKTVLLPKSVRKIEFAAFKGCCKLERVELPEELEDIESNVFSGCEAITKIEIPKGIKRIWSSTFEDCKSLTKVFLNEGLEECYLDAFEGCDSLKQIWLPDTVVDFGYKPKFWPDVLYCSTKIKDFVMHQDVYSEFEVKDDRCKFYKKK